MNLSQLFEMQKAGAFRVDPNSTTNSVIVGGVRLTKEQSIMLATQLGWTIFTEEPRVILDKTDKMIKNLRASVFNKHVIETAQITMQNYRKSDSDKHYERINICGEGFNLSILHGMAGLGGSYAVFDSLKNQSQPIGCGRSISSIAEYINRAC